MMITASRPRRPGARIYLIYQDIRDVLVGPDLGATLAHDEPTYGVGRTSSSEEAALDRGTALYLAGRPIAACVSAMERIGWRNARADAVEQAIIL